MADLPPLTISLTVKCLFFMTSLLGRRKKNNGYPLPFVNLYDLLSFSKTLIIELKHGNVEKTQLTVDDFFKK